MLSLKLSYDSALAKIIPFSADHHCYTDRSAHHPINTVGIYQAEWTPLEA
ncbi:hypothetical protein [Leptolyngbya sp. FACHB-17]|nr:hypothetical protein [Leptolyngbya sp. FACHB-17]MBD2081572.1 hypothetical protein [Leptolyngbya sp. FACHB-17]